jgi:ADP-L-glycero-D-manno-heptose 6-epimerase
MIVVTGAAGFIGSNIVRTLNKLGRKDILAVDDLTKGEKFINLVGCQILDYLDKEDFKNVCLINKDFKDKIEVIFHQGANSETTCWDGKSMMQDNYDYSKILLHYCMDKNINFIYASSAAVYGTGESFEEHPANESPLNVYGYSKLLFDNYVRQLDKKSIQIAGLRYFNVFGFGESHKGSMASTAFHFYNQAKETGSLKLFAGNDGYSDGMQQRDFVYVQDVVDVNLWLMKNPDVNGVFNVGTGSARTFNDMAKAVLNYFNSGNIEYIDFPARLQGRYQSYTQANLSLLRSKGYNKEFTTLEHGVAEYCKALSEKS